MSRSWHSLSLLALLLITGCVYWSGLSGSFMFDDNANIVNNGAVHGFNGSFSSLVASSFGGYAGPWGRPISVATFALNYHFFGAQPFSFKLVNLLIHLGNGLLVFVLVRHLMPRLVRVEEKHTVVIASLWVTAVWLLHPINLTPVLFVVQRMTSLAAFFTLAALCLYLYGRQTSGYKAWGAIAASLLLCWPAAVLSKESGVLFPLFVFLSEWLVLGSFQSIPRKTKLLGALGICVIVIVILAARWNFITGGYAIRDFGLAERLMTQARVLWLYLLQLLLPSPDLFSLHHDDISISRGLLSPPETVAAIAAGLLLVAFIVFRHKTSPLLTFAIAWFLVGHSLESTILPLEIAYEHRNYLATLGILIWLAAALFPSSDSSRWKTARVVLAICFLVFCGFVTALRSDMWGDEYRRTQIEAAVHPNSARANNEAAIAIMNRTPNVGDPNSPAYRMARFHFERAAELDQSSKHPLMGLMYLDCFAKAPKDSNVQAMLRERFANARLSLGDRGVVQSLSGLLIEQRLCLEDDEVKALLEAALSNPFADGPIRGMIYAVAMDYAAAKIGSVPQALGYARAAVNSDPGSATFRVNLIHLLLQSGDKEEARRQYTDLGKLRIGAHLRGEVELLGRKLDSMG